VRQGACTTGLQLGKQNDGIETNTDKEEINKKLKRNKVIKTQTNIESKKKESKSYPKNKPWRPIGL
jgi:hypothetical protein